MPQILKQFQLSTPADVLHFHRIVSQAGDVRTHFDLLIWLQGEMQYYLPHEVMVAAWGNFTDGVIQHDVISPMAGARTQHADVDSLKPMLMWIYRHWVDYGRNPCALRVGENGFLPKEKLLQALLGGALKSMRSALVHGLCDERNGIECLYVTFSTRPTYSEADKTNVGVMLPHIDVALRQVSHLPEQPLASGPLNHAQLENTLKPGHNMSTREVEIMFWVALGKTSSDIGRILNISEFTVKNHMQRVFKKLDVINRAQAVSKFKALCT
ncbi:transcriptional regulator EpsA [Rhodoferax fermentans]|uniref:Transcriptional regulator EpsA n=1 Tax=Rhodoferax fermentans TaxID=28066 RepID=A0A1T1AYF9_RHOFE|nr:transcriptional regulator EpsA [Rhodoferax fermentans]